MKTSARAGVPAPSPIQTYLTNEQCEVLLQQAKSNQDLCDVLTLALETGMRKGEIQQLRWADVDFEQSNFFIPEKYSPVKRFVPMSDRVKGVLESRIGGQHDSEFVFGACAAGLMRRVSSRLSALLRSLGLKGGFHTLRCTWATRLLNAGMSLHTLCALGGWSTRAWPFKVLARPSVDAAYRAALKHLPVNGIELSADSNGTGSK